jgi:phenylacetate-CoA ligase
VRGIEDELYGLAALYVSSPQWVKSTAGRLYSVLPTRLRQGSLYRGFAEQARIRDPAAVRQLQRQKLRATLDLATRFVPAYQRYRDQFEQADDIEAFLHLLPLTEKEALRRDREAYVTTSPRKKAALAMETSGTVVPLPFFLEKGHSRPRETAFMQAMRERLGDDGSGYSFSLRGRSVRGLDPVAGRWVMVDPIRRLVIGSTDHLKPDYIHLYTASLRRWRPRRVEGFPSSIYLLAKWLRRHPHDDAVASIKFVYLFSENVHDHQRELIATVFRCPVINHYGMAERILFAHSLPDDPRLHFWPQYGYLELLDQRGEPVTAAGERGEIVGTSFDNAVMPFIRYRTNDYAVVADPPSRPDDAVDVVERIEGRLQEFFVTHDERLLRIGNLYLARFSDYDPIEDMQYLQERPGELILRVVAGSTLPEDYRRELAGALSEKMQNGCTVTIVQVDSIERTRSGKKMVIDQRIDISRYLDARVGEAPPG